LRPDYSGRFRARLAGVRTRVAKVPTEKERDPDLMAGLGKEVKGAVKKAAGEKKGSGGKKGKKSGGSGSGADKAKRAAREILK
jgi:hypothetical protein